ncbi:unknown [Prevotella sp. CAG:1185]|nr:unknown [Prevotella sp. CAG:1185]
MVFLLRPLWRHFYYYGQLLVFIKCVFGYLSLCLLCYIFRLYVGIVLPCARQALARRFFSFLYTINIAGTRNRSAAIHAVGSP